MGRLDESQSTDNHLTGNAFSTPVDTQNEFVPPQGLLYEAMRRGDLARKIFHGQKLTKKEKQEAYFFLTGKNPPPSKKRGRPPARYRDFNLAADYLNAAVKSKKGSNKLKILREKLTKKYGLPWSENTFYSALKRGRKEIRFFHAEVIRRAEEGSISDPQRAKSLAHDLLLKVENYEKQNKHLQKNEKK